MVKMNKYINIKWVDEENIPLALSLSAWKDLRWACLYLGPDGNQVQPVVPAPLLLSTVLWPSEERVGGLEEPEGRACSPPWAGATCRWRGVGSWELISWLTEEGGGEDVEKTFLSWDLQIGEAAFSINLGLG